MIDYAEIAKPRPTTTPLEAAREELRVFALSWVVSAARGKSMPPTIGARLEQLLDTLETQARAEAVTDSTPIPLRWDRLVMHPAGEDEHTIVACMTDDGRPAALFLDDEHREALGLQLVDPDPDGDACQVHSPTGDPCDCGHDGGADCHPKEIRP